MKARLNLWFWFFFIGWRASLFRSIFMWLVSHIVLFLPWLSPGIVRLLSVLAVFTFFILILCGAVVGIQWLSCFHFLRLNVAIMLHLRLYMNRAEGEVCINEKITQPKSFYWDHNKLAQ